MQILEIDNRVKKYFFIAAFALFYVLGFAQIPAGYYDGTDGLTGDALKTALHNIIKGHTELSYDAVKEALKNTDEDTLNTNNVICFYTGWSYPKTEFGNGSEQWNREHTWSKSHGDFGNNPPCGTDLHHIRPTDASVNSAKNNRDFDYGTVQYIDGSGPTNCYESTNIWEPRDEVKGDVARMIFYMATRYEGDNGEPDLEVVDYVNTAPNKEPYYGKLSTLLAWNTADPVDNWERNRNDIIYYSYQNNRNPFIDHPEFVDSIWGGGSSDTNTNLIISEVADPANAANAKFVELYNNSDSTIDFSRDTWYLSRQANGGTWANIQLTGTVGAGETFVISYRTTDFFNAYGFNANMNSGVVSGNGNDGYFLYYGGNNTTGTLVDAYGVIDVDGTGQGWEYTNSKAVRVFTVTAPGNTWTAPEWIISSTADDTDMTPEWHHKTLEWNGNVSNDWNTAANWSDGGTTSTYPPDAGSKVTITNTANSAKVTGEASCGVLTIDVAATLTIKTGSVLNIGGK